jgi:hypothetical protein
MEKIISSITEIVPQITYDIIARFVPGTMAILSWAIVAKGPTGDELDELLTGLNSVSGWAVLLFLLVAYIVSIVLYGIWILTETIWERVHARLRRSSDSKAESIQVPYNVLVYDAIRIKSPAVGARIVKLRAEIRQSQVLIVGWMIASILNLVLLTGCWSMHRALLELALVSGIIGAYSFRWHLNAKYVASIENHGRILQLDQEPWFTTKDRS